MSSKNIQYILTIHWVEKEKWWNVHVYTQNTGLRL